MKINFFNLYIFLFVFMTLLIIYYMNIKLSSCYSKKKEGMINSISSGGMQGYIKRRIHPIKRQIKNTFTGSSKITDYYTNKLNQILR
jgi:hypothetical protein